MIALILISTFLSFNLFSQCSGGYPCLNLQPMTDFDAEEYSGIWYGMARFMNEYDEKYKCNKYNFTKEADTINIKADVQNESDSSAVVFNPIFSYIGDPSVANFMCNIKEKDPDNSFHILIAETDYLTYQFLYGCDDNHKKEYSWILTRDRDISDHTYEKLISVAKKYETNTNEFVKINQKGCHN